MLVESQTIANAHSLCLGCSSQADHKNAKWISHVTGILFISSRSGSHNRNDWWMVRLSFSATIFPLYFILYHSETLSRGSWEELHVQHVFVLYPSFLFPLPSSTHLCEMICLLTNQELFNLPGQWGKNIKKNQISSSQLSLCNPCVEIWITDAPRFGTSQRADMATRAEFHTEKHESSSIINTPHSFLSRGCETTLWPKQLKNKGLILHHSLRSIMATNSKLQELRATVTLHPQPDKEDSQQMHAAAQLLIFIQGMTSRPREWCCPKWTALHTSAAVTKIISHRNSQR